MHLHEILAIESGLEEQSHASMANVGSIFTTPVILNGTVKTLTMLDEDRQAENLREETKLESTVPTLLKQVKDKAVAHFNAFLSKEATNQEAAADLVVDGKVLALGLPATGLLGLESRLRKIADLLRTIPTLPQGIEWKPDEVAGDGVWAATQPTQSRRTEKTMVPVVLSEATKEHPAQVTTVNKDVVIGKIEASHTSGLMPASQKQRIVDRMETLIAAVKQARQRANSVEVRQIAAAEDILGYVLND